MGVQKSKKAIRFSKYSLFKTHKKNINKYLLTSKLRYVYKKNKHKKTNIFFLKKYENNKSVFFN